MGEPPRVLSAPRAQRPLRIDGDLQKPEWTRVAWCAPFRDISGHLPDPDAANSTQVKMLWDSDYLYVAARMRRTLPVRAQCTQRNMPIFHTDSDFEVFVDPGWRCHRYKELEINPSNVVWNLQLDRPYSDGGRELSGRVAAPGESDYYEVARQKTACRLVRGRLDGPEGEPAEWVCELALAHSDSMADQPGGTLPAEGGSWRINFSAVERGGEINWTWSRQWAWQPGTGRYEGEVNMHSWGFVCFAPASDSGGELELTSLVLIPLCMRWEAQQAAMTCYAAQHAFRREHGRWASSLQELRGLLDERAVGRFEGAAGSSRGVELEVSPADDKFWVVVRTAFGCGCRVDQDRLHTWDCAE